MNFTEATGTPSFTVNTHVKKPLHSLNASSIRVVNHKLIEDNTEASSNTSAVTRSLSSAIQDGNHFTNPMLELSREFRGSLLKAPFLQAHSPICIEHAAWKLLHKLHKTSGNTFEKALKNQTTTDENLVKTQGSNRNAVYGATKSTPRSFSLSYRITRRSKNHKLILSSLLKTLSEWLTLHGASFISWTEWLQSNLSHKTNVKFRTQILHSSHFMQIYAVILLARSPHHK